MENTLSKKLLSEDQITSYLTTVSGWERQEQRICKTFETKSFSKGSEIVSKIAPVADEVNHHPDILVTFPRLKIELTTHDAGGLTELDFDMAEKIDRILSEYN